MKRRTKIILGGSILLGLSITTTVLFKKNQQLKGQISNQQIQINGLMKELKNLSYQLGKFRKY